MRRTSKIRIAGTEFIGEPKAVKSLNAYFKEIDKQLKGNEDAVAVAEDMAVAVRDKLLDRVGNILSKITYMVALEVIQSTGLPDTETEQAAPFMIKDRIKLPIGISSTLFILFGIFLVTIQGPVSLLLTNLAFKWTISNSLDYWITPLRENFMIYFTIGFWPMFSFLIYSLLGLVCIAVGVISLRYVIKNRFNKRLFRIILISQVALLAIIILWFGSIQMLRSSTWERISASNNRYSLEYFGCGRYVKIPVAGPGQDSVLLYNSIKDGWKFIMPASSVVYEGVEDPDKPYIPTWDCTKINQYYAEHPNQKIVLMLYRAGTDGQIYPPSEANRSLGDLYYGIFVQSN